MQYLRGIKVDMHRFFVDYEIKDTVVISESDDVKHITKSLRVQIGEKLEVCDIKGTEYIVEVTEMNSVVNCKIIEQNSVKRESPIKIDLIQGLAKGSKMDLIIQKAVELGVNMVIPCKMDRSIVKLDEKGASKKVDRWQKIADEAAKQSKRSVLPKVHETMKLSNLKNISENYDLILVAYELENKRELKEIISRIDVRRVAVVIGPEGGLTSDEVDGILSLGGHSISLGPRILRTETAGLACLSILQYELGDMN